MKTLRIISGILILLVLFSGSSPAQQDYKIVQDFKNECQRIKDGINKAGSLEELNQFALQINQLAADNTGHKELLDKSLYPDDFSGSVEKLRKALEIRKEDFTQITTLENQVSDLNTQMDELNKKNAELLLLVNDLTAQSKKDKNKIAQLQRSIYALRQSLRKRDELVMNMIDSLIPADFRNSGSLTGDEKQGVFSEAQKKNILGNVQNAINENIRFLKSTTLQPADLKSIKEKQAEFLKTWQSFGPKIIEIYAEKGKNVQAAQKIDSAFEDWNKAINLEAWNSISQEFANYGISLNRFNSGKEFTAVLSNYTSDEIKNAKVKGGASARAYDVFADTAWFGKIKPDWVPYLIDNNQLTVAQKDTIEAGISRWKDAAYPASLNWLYIIIAMILGAGIILLARRNYNKNHNAGVTVPDDSE